MNKNRMLIGAAIALVCGFAASRYVYVKMKEASSAVRPVKVTPVVVAAAPLQLGTRLEPGQLRVIQWPAGSEPAGTCAKVEDCSGRALITAVNENEPILNNKLAPLEAGAGLPVAIPEGMRAVAIRVDDVVGIAGFVMPGSMVDVLVTGDPATKTGGGNTMTRTFLEDVRVLAAGQRVQQDKDGKPQTESVVTLLVTPHQADLLALATHEGRINLALRNTIDTKQINPPPVYRASLFFDGAPQPKPAAPRAPARVAAPRPAPSPYMVEVIRGDKRENHSFPENSAANKAE